MCGELENKVVPPNSIKYIELMQIKPKNIGVARNSLEIKNKMLNFFGNPSSLGLAEIKPAGKVQSITWF